MTVVSSTPMVAKVSPGPMTGLISLSFVSIPPVKRITQSAPIPTNCACPTLSNSMPRPSLQNSIPATRNSNKAGRPKRPPALVMSILQKIRMEPTKRTFSEVKYVIECIFIV